MSTHWGLLTGVYSLGSAQWGLLWWILLHTANYLTAYSRATKKPGALNASGTTTNPIVLRGAVEQAGYWRGLQYFFTSSFQNVLDNVIIQHGGGGSAPAAVHMRCNTSSPGQLTISNSAIELSGSYGIRVDNSGCTYTETAVTFSGNTLGDYNGPM